MAYGVHGRPEGPLPRREGLGGGFFCKGKGERWRE